MFAILSVLTPSIITMRINEKLTKKKEKDLYKSITNFIILVLLINIISCALLIKVFDAEWVRVSLFTNLNMYTIYMIIYSIVNIVVGLFIVFIKFVFRNVEFDFETKSKKNNL